MERTYAKQVNILTTHVLDDDKDMNEILEELFNLNGLTNYKFFVESDSFLAAFDDKVHIAVIDYSLHGALNGIDITRIVKSRNKRCKVIMVSGQEQKKVFIECINLHIDGYVDKNEKDYVSKVVTQVQLAIEDLKEQFELEEQLLEMREEIKARKARRTNESTIS